MAAFDRHRIRTALDRSGITLRQWQRAALIQATDLQSADCGLITATMGAGKSIVIALLCSAWTGQVVVTTPTVALTEQLRGTIANVIAEPVGGYYTHDRSIERVTVCCLASASKLASEWAADSTTLVIVDEAHRAEREGMAELLQAVQPVRRVGFSATPYGADSAQRLALWTHEAYRYTVDQAVQDGALVPMRLVMPRATDLERDSFGRVDADAWIAEAIRGLDGPGVVSARDIADAEAYAAELCDGDIPAEAIHSRMSRARQRDATERLRTGGVKVLVHCHMLSEGVDLPWLRWLVLRHPRGSRVEFAQEIGRVLRAHAGKLHGIVVDPFGVTLEHRLQDVAAIGEAIERQQAAELAERVVLIDPLTGEPLGLMDDMPAPERRKLRMRSELQIYSAAAFVALQTAGVIAPSRGDGKWRHAPATGRQRELLGRFVSFARKAMTERGRICPTARGDAALHVWAVSLCVTRLWAVEDARAGVVSDVCALATAVLWGRGVAKGEAVMSVRKGAFEALRRYGVDPTALLETT